VAVISNATTFAPGPYAVPNARIEGTCVYTNNPPCGAMRGFGAVQVCFAHEGQMDKLAAALGMDPVELRLRNAAETGTVLHTGQVIRGTAPVREVIERTAAIPLPPHSPDGPRDAIELPGGVAGNVGKGEGIRRGIGFAVGYKNQGYSAGFDDYSEARVTLSRGPEGPVAEIHSAAAELGQGLQTIMAQIARTILGIERVILRTADTFVGSSGSSSASRQTLVSGGAVKAASEAVLAELLERARRDARVAGADLGVDGGFVTADGEPVMAVGELLGEPIERSVIWRHRPTAPLEAGAHPDVHPGFLFAAQRAVVDVDEELGLVRVVQLATAQDVGFAINPQSVVGQIEGGSAQGLGLALMEELQLEDGSIRNASFTDYLLPTTLDMPPVEAVLVEEPDPDGPFGAKGVGEPANIVAPAAIVAALRAALGRDLQRIPVKPDELAGLREPPGIPAWPPFPDEPMREPAALAAGIFHVGAVPAPDERSEGPS
jgi:CO/xanthine dehydrogenase Mo-binding subunit